MAERQQFADHEDDPEEFADWDAYERARAGRVRGSGVVVTVVGRARTVVPSWHSMRVDRPDDLEFPDGPEVAEPNPNYL